MSALFMLPKAVPFTSDGLVIPGAKLYFYASGTTTPLTVYNDSDLAGGHEHAVPVVADSAGRFAPIYIPTGAYKVKLTDAADVEIYTVDELDTGLPAGSGVLPVANGGTAASTAAGARTALGAAAAADLTSLSNSLGDLAVKDTVSRAELASGFGVVILQRSLIGSTTSLVTCSTTMPDDDTIPQVGEGTEVLTGNFTPVSASSTLAVAVQMRGASSTTNVISAALFTAASASAIAGWQGYGGSAGRVNMDYLHSMASPGTNAIAFSVRAGGASGNFYVNGESGGNRRLGGVQKAQIIVTEFLAY